MKILTIILLIISFAGFPLQSEENEICDSLFELASDSLIRQHIRYLASDELQGRAVGTKGELMAAEYLSAQLKNYNVKPLVPDNSYYQNVLMHSILPLETSKLCLYLGDSCRNLNMYQDYVVYKPGINTYIPKPIEMVFVGYGITAPEFDYDDYNELDVTGKIVVFVGGEPHSNKYNYFDGEFPSIYSSAESKQRLALAHGAYGSIYIPEPAEIIPGYWQGLVNDLKFEFVTLAYSVSDNLSLSFNPGIAEFLFNGSEWSLSDVYQMVLENNIHSFPLKTKLEFRGQYKTKDFIGYNVAGIVEGSDDELKDSYVILSAHYDHLGIGPVFDNDSIYNGLLDNALGCAGVLEMARLYSSGAIKPKRSIIFLFVTGEEKGLLGSRFYTDRPLKPLHKTVANINVDGLAYIDEFKSLIPIGSAFSTLDSFIESTAEQCNLVLDEFALTFAESEAFNRSDQIAFAQAGIPSCMVLDGLQYKNVDQDYAFDILKDYFLNIYHSPFDDLSQPLNYRAAKQHIQYLLMLSLNISNSSEPPKWKDNIHYFNVGLRNQTEKK